jgi:hypothetical protein
MHFCRRIEKQKFFDPLGWGKEMGRRPASDSASKTGKSEVVTIRLEPKLRYLAEIAARKHRRSLSSYIEWAIDQSFKSTILDLRVADDFSDRPISVADEAERLWDVDEPDRFVKLALRHPDLLTHDEQVIWKLVRENGSIWKGHFDRQTGEWTWEPSEEHLSRDRLRESWEKFCSVAYGSADKSTLPSWLKVKPKEDKNDGKSPAASGVGDIDPSDEIPF